MQLYNCQVRLANSPFNMVRKRGVTAPEVVVLRHVHGEEAVVDVELAGEVKRTDREERERLHNIYTPALKKRDPAKGFANSLGAIFGVGTPLPVHLPDVEANVVEPEASIRRHRVAPAKEPAPLDLE